MGSETKNAINCRFYSNKLAIKLLFRSFYR